MEVFEAVAREWGNSVGITLPKKIIKKARISPKKKIKVLILNKDTALLKKAFGSLKLKKPTQQAMEEIDKGYD